MSSKPTERSEGGFGSHAEILLCSITPPLWVHQWVPYFKGGIRGCAQASSTRLEMGWVMSHESWFLTPYWKIRLTGCTSASGVGWWDESWLEVGWIMIHAEWVSNELQSLPQALSLVENYGRLWVLPLSSGTLSWLISIFRNTSRRILSLHLRSHSPSSATEREQPLWSSDASPLVSNLDDDDDRRQIRLHRWPKISGHFTAISTIATVGGGKASGRRSSLSGRDA